MRHVTLLLPPSRTVLLSAVPRAVLTALLTLSASTAWALTEGEGAASPATQERVQVEVEGTAPGLPRESATGQNLPAPPGSGAGTPIPTPPERSAQGDVQSGDSSGSSEGSGSSGGSGGGAGERVSVRSGIWETIKGIFGGGSSGPPQPPSPPSPPGSPGGGQPSPGGTASIPSPTPSTPGMPAPRPSDGRDSGDSKSGGDQRTADGKRPGQKPGSPDGTRPDGSPEGSPNGSPNGRPDGDPDAPVDERVVLNDAFEEFRKAQEERRKRDTDGEPSDSEAESWPGSESTAQTESEQPPAEQAGGQPGGEETASAEPPAGDTPAPPGSPQEEFERALGEFDGTILSERRVILARNTERARDGSMPEPPPEPAEESGGGGGFPGQPGGDMEIPDSDSRSGGGWIPKDVEDREGDYKHTARRNPPPANIPDGSDDDVFARQLREAAETEADPELAKAMWDEYRRYKQGR